MSGSASQGNGEYEEPAKSIHALGETGRLAEKRPRTYDLSLEPGKRWTW
jgi:hypothetical protein